MREIVAGNAECRMSNVEGISNFEFRICFGFRISGFGFLRFAPHVLANRYEFHLGRDDAAPRVS